MLLLRTSRRPPVFDPAWGESVRTGSGWLWWVALVALILVTVVGVAWVLVLGGGAS